jgi:hypothetical protein
VVDSSFDSHDKLFNNLYSFLYVSKTVIKPSIPKVDIVFGNTSGDTLAYCESKSLFGIKHGRKIVVNPKVWEESTETSRTVIMLHEMAHCALDRVHVYEYVAPGKCPSTLMIPEKVSDACFEANINYYMVEIFRGIK